MEITNSSLKTRRIFAVILAALAIACLFWPPVMAIRNRDEREAAKDLFEEYDASEQEKTADVWENNLSKKTGSSDAKKCGKAIASVYADAVRPTWSIWNMRAYYENMQTVNRVNEQYYGQAVSSDDNISTIKSYSVLMSIAVFGIMALGAIAIIQYLRSASPLFGTLFVVMVVIGTFLAATAIPNLNDDWRDLSAFTGGVSSSGTSSDRFEIGVGLFLMPILAIVSRALYRQKAPAAAAVDEKAWPSAAALVSHPEPTPAPVSRPETTVTRPAATAPHSDPAVPTKRLINRVSDLKGNPWGDAPKRDPFRSTIRGSSGSAAEPAAPAGPLWTCPVCGRKNPQTEEFCPSCNTKQF